MKETNKASQGQPVHGITNVQAVRPNDENVKASNRPQQPEAKHPNKKPSGEK